MLSIAVLSATLLLFQQTPAPGPAEPAAQPIAPLTLDSVDVDAPPAPSRIVEVCRTEPVTGSRFGRRVCRSRLQTEDERRDSQFMLRRMQGSRFPDGG